MKLKRAYKTQDEIPAQYEDLYTEVDGQWVFSAIEGLPSPEDVANLREALRKEKNDHKATRQKIQDIDPEEVQELRDEVEELRAKVKVGGSTEDIDRKIEEVADVKAKKLTGPLERENAKLKDQIAQLEGANANLTGTIKSSQIEVALRRAAEKASVVGTAIDDALAIGLSHFDLDDGGKIITRENAPTGPGFTPEAWLEQMRESRPHWWPTSEGGGATGGKGVGGGTNPWAADNWNVTEQGTIYKKSPDRAAQLAKAAGTTVGGAKPKSRTAA